jgi:N-acetylmuramoyl-L-alanine amidase
MRQSRATRFFLSLIYDWCALARSSSRLIIAGTLLTLAVTTAIARQGTPPRAALPFIVISTDARRPLAASLVGEAVMVSLDDLATLFQLTVREDALAGGVTVGYKGRTVILTAGQALASAAGRLVSLPAPPVRDGRRWLVPVEFVSRGLGTIYDARLDVRKNSRMVLVGDVRVPRIAVRQDAVGAQARVTLAVNPQTPYTIAQEPSRVLVRFDADALDVSLPTFAPQGLLQSIRVSDAGQTVTIDVGPRFGSFRASQTPQDDGGMQVVVELVPAAAEPTAPARGGLPALPVPPLPDMPTPSSQPAAGGLSTVVIDPGHGGEEAGAKGATGVLEKDVTLSLARRLKTLLEGRLGLHVLLTRDADQTVALDDRAALANNSKADVFISLHVGAAMRPSVGGGQIYYFAAEAAGDDARRTAVGRHTLATVGGGSRDIEMIPWEMAQIGHLSESGSLAGAIEEQWRDGLRLGPRPVLQAPLRVLAGANMPAVLIEIGFLSNPDEEQRLVTDAYQSTVAQALVDGLRRYREVAEQAQLLRNARPSAPQPVRRRP